MPPEAKVVARVTRLSTTPVKGFALHHPDRVDLDESGARGNRAFFLVDERDRLLSITRTGAFAGWTASFDPVTDTLAFTSRNGQVLTGPAERGRRLVADFYGDHGVSGHVVAGPWDAPFSEAASHQVRLVRTVDPGAGCDEYPVTLLADESVAALSAQAGAPVDPRRFRMLLGIDGVPAFAEEGWRHRLLRVGGAVLRVGGPVPRCAAITRDPDSGDSDLRALHLIADIRGRQPNEFGDGLNLGAYATVTTPGTVAVGDAVTLDG